MLLQSALHASSAADHGDSLSRVENKVVLAAGQAVEAGARKSASVRALPEIPIPRLTAPGSAAGLDQ